MYALKASLGGSATEMQLGWIGVGDRAEGPWLGFLEWLFSQSRIPVGFHNQNSPLALVSQDEPKVHQRQDFGAEVIRHNMWRRLGSVVSRRGSMRDGIERERSR
jgi:hypothetical protein